MKNASHKPARSKCDSDYGHHRVLALAIPIILSNMTVPLVGIVDTAVMGRMADPSHMGATAIGAIIFSSVFWLFGFLRMGTGGLVAQALGAAQSMGAGLGDAGQGPHTTTTATRHEVDYSIYRALLIAGALAATLLLLQQPIIYLALKAFTADEALKQLVYDYYSIRIYAAPATLLGYVVLGALIGLQNMRGVLLLQLILNGVNILLTIGFFHWFDWGIKGVASATVIAEYVALAVGLFLLRSQLTLKPLAARWSILLAAEPLRRLIEMNGNLFVRTLCLTLAFYWLTQSGARMGTLTLAANATLIHMVHFMAHALDGFAHAAETLCGYAYGQKNRAKFNQAVRYSALWGFIFALAFTVVYGLAGEWIIAMMTTLLDVREHAKQWLPWIVLTPLFAVLGFLLDGIYIGTTHTREMRDGMLVSLLVFVGSNLILVHLFGNTGLWVSYFILMLTRSATLVYTWPRILRHLDTITGHRDTGHTETGHTDSEKPTL